MPFIPKCCVPKEGQATVVVDHLGLIDLMREKQHLERQLVAACRLHNKDFLRYVLATRFTPGLSFYIADGSARPEDWPEPSREGVDDSEYNQKLHATLKRLIKGPAIADDEWNEVVKRVGDNQETEITLWFALSFEMGMVEYQYMEMRKSVPIKNF